MPIPDADPDTRSTDRGLPPWRTPLTVIAWALAGAMTGGGTWIASLLLTGFTGLLPGEDGVRLLGGGGAALGLLVGMAFGLLRGGGARVVACARLGVCPLDLALSRAWRASHHAATRGQK